MRVNDYPVFMRCEACQRVITKEQVERNGLKECRCGKRRFHMTSTSLFEDIKYLVLNPSAVRFLWQKQK